MEDLDIRDDEGFYQVILQDYTNEEVKVFVQCLMSKNIQPEDTMRCLTAIGCNMDLSHEVYQEMFTDDEGNDDSYPTSEFQEFVNEGVDALLYEHDTIGWAKFLLKTLLKRENYELLAILKLETTWNI